MKAADTTSLKRPVNKMPAHIIELLSKEGLTEAYNARPAYQRNDYLGWISRAKLEATQHKRTAQMIAELKKGDVYMNMDWPPGRKQ
jgi:uncharacterized protein YdeI (YjbR/CyaY-like superfamily)